MTSIVWFRDDLRLADHPALRAAIERDEPLIGLYVLDEDSPGIRALGGAARWWLHHSLASLGERMRERGGELVLRRGAAADVVPRVVADAGADAVFWNRRYGAAERAVDSGLKASLRDGGVVAESFAGHLLFEPWTVRTGTDTPYSVFTPYWRACLRLPAPRHPLAAPRELARPGSTLATDRLDDWGLLPRRPDWSGGLADAWDPGEPAARARLTEFLDEDLDRYDDARDRPAHDVTSRLSPRLRWGEVSPFTVWHEALQREHASVGGFLREIGWREFAWHTLFHFPDLATKNWRSAFDAFEWPRLRPTQLTAWQQGRTGFSFVDAGMRELWSTGSMHNRARMAAASFLVKNLRIDWRHGERWFWDTLVDADAANNAFNWQWVTGSGADAAPYFRIFNPETQAKKFDADGAYARRWAPEHLGDRPPAPIVDLAESRKAALDAYEAVKRASP